MLEFAAIEYFAVPAPVPLAPDTIEIHALSITAVQLQPESALTVTDAAPPAAENELPVGEIDVTQELGARA